MASEHESDEKIAERKKELNEQRAYLTAVVNHCPLAIVTFDRQSRVQLCNPAFERLFLYSQAEIVGKKLDDVLVPLEAARDASELTSSTLEGHEVYATGRRLRKDGTLADVEIFGGPMVLEGKIIGTCALYGDISERLHAAETVRASEERRHIMAQALEGAGDCISITDVEDHILYVNDAFLRTYGYDEKELIGQSIVMLRSARTSARLQEEILPGTLAGSWSGEIWNQAKDGREFPISLKTSAVCDEEGRRIALIGIARDITERRHHEEELVAAKDAAEAATRAKSEFLANMSHEIRTPMNGIMGMTELVLESNLNGEQRECLEMVKSSADALLSVINDILDFSKIEAGKLDLCPIHFNLRDCVADATKILAMRAGEKGLNLTFAISPAVPEMLVGDPDRVRQILVNLVGNAVKFTSKGEVHVQVEEESRTGVDSVLHFAISDTGLGISPEKQELIFKPFSQADNSTTRQYGGTGLGLSISSRLVDLMNGRIWVNSQPGEGSVFHFTATFGPVDTPKRPGLATTADLLGERVLIVDDNATNRRILYEVFTNWQMIPELVDSGQAAKDALEEARETGRHYSLIVLDSQMPNMDGFELAEWIQKHGQLRNGILMMLTSAGRRGDAERCRQLGITGYLTKPIKQSELLKAVLRVLEVKPNERKMTPLITRWSSGENRRRPCRILLAEDNAVNARLAVRLLQNLGHSVRQVGNGREALLALQEEAFDLLVMDVQMPEMDGFEATASIRRTEKETGRHLPIIALTAHALKGDREHCLEAGMDGYVVKPIQIEQLKESIDSLAPRDSRLALPASLKPDHARDSEQLLSPEVILARFDGDREILAEVLELFIDTCPQMLMAIHTAVREGDAKTLQLAAHSFRGAAGNFCAGMAMELATLLESMGKADTLLEAPVAAGALAEQMSRTRPLLLAFAAEMAPCAS